MIRIKRVTHHDVLEVRHCVLWPNEPLEFVKLDNDEKGIHFGLYVSNSLVSVVSVFVNNKEAQFRKFATLEAHQGNGYGSRLLEHMLKEVKAMGVRRIWCDARLSAVDFYKRFGFERTDEDIFYKKDVQYVKMETVYSA